MMLKVFLNAVNIHAEFIGWDNTIMMIPDVQGVGQKLTTQYELITLGKVQANTLAYIGVPLTAKQVLSQLAKCIQLPLKLRITLKLKLYMPEYNFNNMVDGPCLLKTLIMVVTL